MATKTDNIPNDNTSVKTKQTVDWFKRKYDYLIDLSSAKSSKENTNTRLDAANSNISYEYYDYVLNPVTDKEEPIKLPGSFKNMDFITPIKEKNLGEYMELPNKAFVTVRDRNALLRKQSVIAEKLRPVIAQAIVNRMNEQNVDTQVDSADVGNIQEIAKKVIDEYTDEYATKHQHLLNHINDINDFDIFRYNGFFHFWATEEVYAHRYIDNGEVVKELLDPRQVFPIDNGEEFVKDMNACVIRRRLPVTKLLYKHRNILTKDQKEMLNAMVYDRHGNEGNSLVIPITSMTNFQFPSIDGMEADTSKVFSDSDTAFEYTIYFVSNVPIYTLTYMNPLGEILEREVDSKYKVDVEFGDIEVKKKYVPKVFVGYRFGDYDTTSIYIKPMELDVQTYDQTGYPELPVNGRVGLLSGNAINPIASRIAHFQAFYNLINLYIERELANHKGVLELIPESILGSKDDARAKFFYRKADRTLIYDDSRISIDDVSKGYLFKGDISAFNYIAALINLRDSVKRDADELANMNDARYGNAAASQTVTNNSQNLYRAKLGSTLMITVYNKFIETEHNLDLAYGKAAYVDGKDISYIDPDSDEAIFDFVTEDDLSVDSVVKVMNSAEANKKMEDYKNLAFAASQNGEMEMAVEAIEAKSPAEIRKYIKEYNEIIEKRRQEEMQMEQMKLEAAKEERLAAETRKHNNEIDKLYTKGEIDRSNQISIDNNKARLDNNNNNKS